MAIYTISTNPKNIPGLQFWLDASDQSSMNLYKTTIGSYSVINSGTTYSGTNSGPGVDWKNGTSILGAGALTYSSWSQSSIISMVDKKSGITLTTATGFGSGTPKYFKYDYNSVNGKNSILFNRFTNGELSLTNTNIPSTFNSLTHSLYFVFATGYTSSLSIYGTYPLSIYKSGRTASVYPNIGIGINISGTTSYYLNIETDQTSSTLTPYTAFSFTDDTYSKSIIFSTRLNGTSTPDPARFNLLTANKNIKFFGLTGTPGSSKSTTGVSIPNARFILGDLWDGTYATTSNPAPPIGRFCEMLYYNTMLSDTDNDKVVQYLKNKWVNPESPIQYIQPAKFYKSFTTGALGSGMTVTTSSYEVNISCVNAVGGRYANANIFFIDETLLPSGPSILNSQLYAKIEITGTNGYTASQRGFGIWLGEPTISNNNYFSTTASRPPDIYIPPGSQGVYETNCYWGGSTSSYIYFQLSNEVPLAGKTWSGNIKFQLGSTQYGL
jgi:hypothetical protein